MATIGSRIKDLRMRLGLSQVEFASRIGVSKQTLYKYENDIVTNIPSDKIELISKEFDVSPAILMGWPETGSEEPYYINPETREMAQFLYDHPGHRVLLDASRNLQPSDIEAIIQIINRMN